MASNAHSPPRWVSRPAVSGPGTMASLEPRGAHSRIVGVVRVYIPRHADEEGHIRLSECAGEGGLMTDDRCFRDTSRRQRRVHQY